MPSAHEGIVDQSHLLLACAGLAQSLRDIQPHRLNNKIGLSDSAEAFQFLDMAGLRCSQVRLRNHGNLATQPNRLRCLGTLFECDCGLGASCLDPYWMKL